MELATLGNIPKIKNMVRVPSSILMDQNMRVRKESTKYTVDYIIALGVVYYPAT